MNYDLLRKALADPYYGNEPDRFLELSDKQLIDTIEQVRLTAAELFVLEHRLTIPSMTYRAIGSIYPRKDGDIGTGASRVRQVYYKGLRKIRGKWYLIWRTRELFRSQR